VATEVTPSIAMDRALFIAKRGTGRVHPNPRVGCVLIHQGSIISEGWHAEFGGPHAEVVTLQSCPHPPADAILVVTLEPCSHHGKTPPCTDAIIASGVRHVVVGAIDPNPIVSNRGIERLRAAGIHVEVGVREAECRSLIRAYAHAITTRSPYVILKLAQSLDGAVASSTGRSAWISSEESRKHVHLLRAEADAVLVGVGTVRADDPQLTVRHVDYPSPRRMIIDHDLSLSTSSTLVETARELPVTVYTSMAVESSQAAIELNKAGVDVVGVPLRGLFLDVQAILQHAFATYNTTSLLVEGGAATASAFLDAGAVNELHLHVAPILLGRGPRWFSFDVSSPSEAPRWDVIEVQRVGSDVHIVCRPK